MGEGCESSVKVKIEDQKAVMDTPKRSTNNEIATTVAVFEDSPVFDFLNSLSPIKPVRSTHITQAINPLSFVSLPSIFTSPRFCFPEESRVLRRHQFPDPSQPEFSSYDQNTVDTSNSMAAITELDDQQENLDAQNSHGEAIGRTCNESSKLVVENVENTNYDHSSPKSLLRPCSGLQTKPVAEYACSSSTLVNGREMNLDGVSQTEQNKEATSCSWDSLVVDAPDTIIFESPNDTESYKQSIYPETSFHANIGNDKQNMHLTCAVFSSEQVGEGTEPESLSTQPGEESEMMENAETHGIIVGSLIKKPIEKMDYEHLSGLSSGMRRRLVYEMAGSLGNSLGENSGPKSSVFRMSDCNTSANDLQPVPTETKSESPLCVLPRLGLHLNALGTSRKDNKIVNHEASSSGRIFIGPNSTGKFHPPTDQKLLNNTSPITLVEGETENIKEFILPAKEACQAPWYSAKEEINSCSPKKRRRSEEVGEGEACKRCNCKKSKCLKLYCECFAAGVYCVEPCACINCFNKPVHVDTVLATRKQIESRNPLAFAPKVIRGPDSMNETGDDSSNTPASARHKRGCNCKRSGCLKKYCECYQGGVGCSVNCRCEGCKNAFGRKDGTEAVEDDETYTTEKNMQVQNLPETAHHNENMDSAPLAMPLPTGRLSVEDSLSNKRPPTRSFPSISLPLPSSFYGSQRLVKPRLYQPPPKFDNQLETFEEDEIPESLREGSPNGDIKSVSPNSKRVAPPHNVGKSSGLRSSRKLILQSIPSFPSLAHRE